MFKVLILALLSATGTNALLTHDELDKQCPGFWKIKVFSARGYIGRKYYECANINEKGCRYYLTEVPDRQKTESGCVYKQEPDVPDVQFYYYTCKNKSQLEGFKHEMTNRYNLHCKEIQVDGSGYH